jgi:hypothetical protein
VDPEFASQVEAFVRVYLIPTAWKLLGAIALWIAGRWVIKLVRTTLGSFLKLRQVDATLASYVEASAGDPAPGLTVHYRSWRSWY